MKFRILFFSALFVLQLSLKAQPYTDAIGVRLGYPFGLLSFKHGFSEHHYMEALLEYRYRGVSIPVLYEYHGNISDIEGFRWYAGGGVGLGYYGTRGALPYWAKDRKSRAEISLQAVGGIEYTLRHSPVNFSLDYRPAYDLLNGWFAWGGFGLGIRYVIK